jgi:hypothetical protein
MSDLLGLPSPQTAADGTLRYGLSLLLWPAHSRSRRWHPGIRLWLRLGGHAGQVKDRAGRLLTICVGKLPAGRDQGKRTGRSS